MTAYTLTQPVTVDGHTVPAGSVLWGRPGWVLFNGREVLVAPSCQRERIVSSAEADAVTTARDEEYQGAPE